jgi:hypothetical protein
MQPLAIVESVVAGEAATLPVRLDPIPVETKKAESSSPATVAAVWRQSPGRCVCSR